MKPGRELDAKVAEVVMELNLSFQMEGEDTKLSGYHYTENYGQRYFSQIPRYSTDITAAWQVVEKMKEQHVFEIGFEYGRWECSFDWDESKASTAPYAICLAALEVVKENTK